MVRHDSTGFKPGLSKLWTNVSVTELYTCQNFLDLSTCLERLTTDNSTSTGWFWWAHGGSLPVRYPLAKRKFPTRTENGAFRQFQSLGVKTFRLRRHINDWVSPDVFGVWGNLLIKNRQAQNRWNSWCQSKQTRGWITQGRRGRSKDENDAMPDISCT